MVKSNELINRFFEPIKLDHPISETDYLNLQSRIDAVSTLALTNNISVYIMDYHNREFLYVSPNPLFLCGHKREKVQKMGYDFFLQVVAPDDFDILLEINKKGFEYFYSQPIEKRCNLTFSCDFNVFHANKMKMMLHHKLTPFVLTETGKMWLSLCVVTLSTQKKSGNAIIRRFDSPERMEYSFTLKKWEKMETIKLSARENEVLRLCAQGYAIKNIADILNVRETTVNFHKTNLFNKFDVNNIAEAVFYATLNNLI